MPSLASWINSLSDADIARELAKAQASDMAK